MTVALQDNTHTTAKTNVALTPVVSVVKKIRFSAAHYYYLPQLSESENKARFGLCANTHGHGHNYDLCITVSGPMDPQTGMVVNLKDLKHILEETVMRQFHFKNINLDVPYFKDKLPTLEHLVVYFWQELNNALTPLSLQLSALRLYEDDTLFVDYWGEIMIEGQQ
ncbi:MAG: 6-carboxytetrahydropterin synthase [Cyanobacteria bacterium]|nr:6-carboxytetrahydropterin synthase [Cyanobacteriota bacterium]